MMVREEFEKYISEHEPDYTTGYEVDYDTNTKYQSMVWIKDEWIAIKDLSFTEEYMDCDSLYIIDRQMDPEEYNKQLLEFIRFCGNATEEN